MPERCLTRVLESEPDATRATTTDQPAARGAAFVEEQAEPFRRQSN